MVTTNQVLQRAFGQARKGQLWCALLALSLSLSLVDLAAPTRSESQLEASVAHDRSVSSAVERVAESQRVGVVTPLRTLGLAGAVVFLYWAASLFNGWVGRQIDSAAGERERSGVLILSQISLTLFAVRLIAPTALPPSIRTGIHLLAILLLAILALKCLTFARRSRGRLWALSWQLLGDDPFGMALLFVPAAIVMAVTPLLDRRGGPMATLSVTGLFLVYGVTLAVVAGLYVMTVRTFTGPGGPGTALQVYELDTAAIVAGVPLLLLPLTWVIASEIQFTFPATTLRGVLAVLTSILVVSAVGLFILQRSGRLRWTGTSVVTGLYFPIAIASLVSFATYHRTLELGGLDDFTIGQRVLPTQQWFEFGRLPLLDLVPADGLSSVGFSSLYALFHGGAHGLDTLVWLPWLPVVVGFLTIYAFLSRVVVPPLAFLITALLPIGTVVVGPFAIALLPVLAVSWALGRPSFSRLLVVWLGLGLLWLWRPGFGLAATVASLVVLGLMLWGERRDGLRLMVGSLIAALLALPAVLLMADLVGAGDGGRALGALVRGAITPRIQALGTIELDPSRQSLAFLLQGLLPLLAILCVLAALFQRIVRQRSVAQPGVAVLYLAVFCVVLPARIWVGPQAIRLMPSLGLLLLALLPVLLIDGRVRSRTLGTTSWLMTTLAMCSLIWIPEAFPLVGSGHTPSFEDWQAGGRRVRFDESRHASLLSVLQASLAEDATFFDFTGSPLLYALAGRRYPLHDIERFDGSSERHQRSQVEMLESANERDQLPVVVFARTQSPTAPTGGLPAAAVSYRISEYIYGNYAPWMEVDGWQLWRRRGHKLELPPGPGRALSSSRVVQHFDLEDLPASWAKADPWDSIERNVVLANLLAEPIVIRPDMPVTLSWQEAIDSSGGSYLSVRARPMQQGSGANRRDPVALTVTYGEPQASSVRFLLSESDTDTGASDSRVALPLVDNPRTHRIHRIDEHRPRWVYRTAGSDPWMRRIVDFATAPPIDRDEELWLRLTYRCSKTGNAQFFFAIGDRPFGEKRSVRMLLAAVSNAEPPAVVTVPVVGGRTGERLTDLRFDPPVGAETEIVGVELLQRPRRFEDYMVRMSAQWKWFEGAVRKLTVSVTAPVLVDSVDLLGGD